MAGKIFPVVAALLLAGTAGAQDARDACVPARGAAQPNAAQMHEAEALYLPTPHAVVAAMLELAGLVTRAELLRALVARQAIPPVAPGDQEIRDRIEAILRAEIWSPSTVIHVEVKAGVVQLWGAVNSSAQRDAIVLAVRGTPGVIEVQPHLGRTMHD